MNPIQRWPNDIQCSDSERKPDNSDQERKHCVFEASEVSTEKEKQTIKEPPCTIQYKQYSLVTKLFRVTDYVLRFIGKLRKQTSESVSLTVNEIQKAEQMWISYVQHQHYSKVFESVGDKTFMNLKRQLGLYVDEKGIIRCRGRFENAWFAEGTKYPVLLPKSDYLTRLIIKKTHKDNLHSGVSQTLANIRYTFWIPQGRSTVKSVLRICNKCRRCEGGPYRLPPFAPFPTSRVTESVPFKRTGIDYFGPLYIKTRQGQQKVWICLFTCLVTRGIHLEVTTDMSTEQLLLCLRRFIAIRGTPVGIISDNASQFKAASDMMKQVWQGTVKNEDIQSYVTTKKIKWRFITEMAPWMGGFYERLIEIVKRSLRKSIGRRLLELALLQTLMKEAESVVNSRPLVYVGDDINSSIALTPNHFLSNHQTTGIPENETKDDETFKPKLLPAEMRISCGVVWLHSFIKV